MLQLVKKYRRCALLALAACLSLTISAAAADVPENQPVALLSASVTAASGSVPSASDIDVASQALAEIEEQEAREAAFNARLNDLLYSKLSARTVSRSASLAADEVVKSAGTSLGQYKLTFYCPCVACNGRGDGKTKIGTTAVEGRTIAVDPRVIPLGSRVYIDGYGVFIAEDTGGAIKSNKIDVFLNSHSRCFQNGVAYADVYLLG